jgi:uncharacterized protein with FMN-binding domain
VKRYPVVMGVTIAGLAGVLSFTSRSGPRPLSPVAGATSSVPRATPSAKHVSHASSTPMSSPTTTTTPTTITPAQVATIAATGASEQYGYGVLAVRVTMTNSKVTDVKLIRLQTADSYSTQIADQVVPILRREVLAAQSTRINGITGATYTSEAYAMSVQSALDKLKSRG